MKREIEDFRVNDRVIKVLFIQEHPRTLKGTVNNLKGDMVWVMWDGAPGKIEGYAPYELYKEGEVVPQVELKAPTEVTKKPEEKKKGWLKKLFSKK